MDVNSVTQLITSVGFPIFCCIAMGWYVNTTMKDLTNTISNNTKVMEKILTKLDLDD